LPRQPVANCSAPRAAPHSPLMAARLGTRPGGSSQAAEGGTQRVCGKYGPEVERALYTALALRMPGARFVALAAADARRRRGENTGRVSVGVPTAQRDAFGASHRRLKWRHFRGREQREAVVLGRFRGGAFRPARRPAA
jgi:hypothetical protein